MVGNFCSWSDKVDIVQTRKDNMTRGWWICTALVVIVIIGLLDIKCWSKRQINTATWKIGPDPAWNNIVLVWHCIGEKVGNLKGSRHHLIVEMPTSGRQAISLVLGNFMLISFLQSASSLRDISKYVESQRTSQPNPLKMTPELSIQITAHAFLLWASVGFLMPLGIIIIRFSIRVQSIKKLKVLFYTHVIVQILASLMATAAAVLSLTNFENSFNNAHQRIGLALYGLIWVQPVIAFLRPHKGMKIRSVWYFLHWLLGTGVCLLGIANIYIGLKTFHERASRSVSLWTVLFTAEVSVMALIYLFQDRWDYVMKQGIIQDEQITPTNHITSPCTNQK
ncbi:cytochrome b561 domain-containing protein [Canna indica]|uniref:Cytochrome b561 domain-containing protein n=1 Tax=Canna indica TaxID=4628 RepID=A0AAQ3KMX3_9LILI|nr:cytochrome b561 domain-containing protein [Canna indica]